MTENQKGSAIKILIFTFLVIYIVIMLFPIYWMFITSFKSNITAYRVPPDWIPKPFTLINYKLLTTEDSILMRYFFNSFVIGFGTVFVTLLIGSLAGYSLSRFRLPGKNFIMVFIIVSQLFPLAVILIPLYIHFTELGLIDTYFSIIFVHSAITLPYSIWLIKGFIDTIPTEIEEAALIDGCTKIGILSRIILHMVSPGLITAGVTSFLMSYREFLFALTLTTTEATRPMSPGIQVHYIGVLSLRWANIMAATTITIIPVIVIYILLQKYVVGGLVGGAVKG